MLNNLSMKFDTTNIKKALKSKKRFNLFDINYTDEEKACLKNFNINKYTDYENYGTIKLNKLKIFLENIGNNDLKQVIILKNIIKKISKTIIDAHKTQFFKIFIKVTNTNDFLVPRWHEDGKFFGRNNETQFVTTLKGPSTLILENEKDTKNFYDLRNKEYEEQVKLIKDNNDELKIIDVIKITEKYENIYRNKLAKAKILQPTNYQGVIFKIGDENSAVHSEPEVNESRTFISIVTGTEKEIKKLKKTYNSNIEN